MPKVAADKSPSAPGIKRRKAGGRPFTKGHKIGPRFQPGVSGNPSGRPKMPEGHKAAMALLEAMGYEAIADILQAVEHRDRAQVAEYVINRQHGKPAERTEHTGKDGGPIQYEDMTTEQKRARLLELAAAAEARTKSTNANDGDTVK